MRSTTMAARRSLRREKPHDGREGRASFVCSDAHVLHKMEFIEKRSIIYLPKRHTILGWEKKKTLRALLVDRRSIFFSDLPFGPQRSKRIQWLRRIRGSEGGTKNMRAQHAHVRDLRGSSPYVRNGRYSQKNGGVRKPPSRTYATIPPVRQLIFESLDDGSSFRSYFSHRHSLSIRMDAIS